MFIMFIYAFIINHCTNPHKGKDLNLADILSDHCKYFFFIHLFRCVSYKNPHALAILTLRSGRFSLVSPEIWLVVDFFTQKTVLFVAVLENSIVPMGWDSSYKTLKMRSLGTGVAYPP